MIFRIIGVRITEFITDLRIFSPEMLFKTVYGKTHLFSPEYKILYDTTYKQTSLLYNKI